MSDCQDGSVGKGQLFPKLATCVQFPKHTVCEERGTTHSGGLTSHLHPSAIASPLPQLNTYKNVLKDFDLKCKYCHMSSREGCATVLFQGYFAHSVLWLIRGKGSTKPYLLFVGFNGEALLASPCLSWDPLTLSAPFICASGVCPLTTIHHSLLSLPVSIFLRVSTRETLGVAT